MNNQKTILPGESSGSFVLDLAFAIAGTTNSVYQYKGYIYTVTDPQTKLLKIGRTKNPNNRKTSLNTGRPVALTNFKYFECLDTLSVEKEVHSALKDYRVTGEWFRVSNKKAISIIKEAIAKWNKQTVETYKAREIEIAEYKEQMADNIKKAEARKQAEYEAIRKANEDRDKKETEDYIANLKAKREARRAKKQDKLSSI